MAMSAYRREIIEDLEVLGCDYLCLSCWSLCITEYISECLDPYGLFLLPFFPQPKTPHKPVGVSLYVLQVWLHDTQLSRDMRNDAKTLNTICKDCRCDVKSAEAMRKLEEVNTKPSSSDRPTNN